MSSTDFLVVLGVLSLATIWKVSSTRSQRHVKQIPGPPSQFLIGNLNDIPKERAWIAYMKMSEQYGSDLLRLNVFGRNLIIVNSLEAASDLFDGRSTIYNSRPRLVMLNELIGFGYGMAFLPYGDHWRGTRKAFHQALGPEGLKRWTDIEMKGAHRLLRNFLEKPDDFMDHIRHMAAEIIMRLAYGIDVQPKNDPYVDIADSGIRAIEASTNAGSYLVDSFPALKHIPEWFPGARFQREAKEWRVFAMAMLEQPYEFFKKHLEEGNVPYCAANVLLERMNKGSQDPKETESIVKATLSSMYAGMSFVWKE
ncbi:hypothetical protein QCA50_002178 [Cerrena zonata]|uniref:Cytochrome P450 n=1 Tax=Cerrena zonata TaxID=2478898 RepID=A0AAW0GYH2_9APHY